MEKASSAAGAPALVVGFAAYGLLLAVVRVFATSVPTVDCANNMVFDILHRHLLCTASTVLLAAVKPLPAAFPLWTAHSKKMSSMHGTLTMAADLLARCGQSSMPCR